MATKDGSACSEGKAEQSDELGGGLALWQKAWLARYRDELVRRVPTVDVVDRLIGRGAIDPSMDVYQEIHACHAEKRNMRARLLLDYVSTQSRKVFWEFQEVLALENCGDLAVRKEDESTVAESFRPNEAGLPSRNTAAGSCTKKKTRPAAVEKVIKKLKKRYRKRTVPSLDGQASRKSLDEIQVNICLLSTEKLDALVGCSGRKRPFSMDSLKEKESSVVHLEDVFNQGENGQVPAMQAASGIAGSGKTTAFTQKAPHEWSKEDSEPTFWEDISLLFENSLTDSDWWNAQTIAEVFRLSSFKLTKEEEDEVVKYIRSHAEEVLLVADALDEAKVNTDSLLWRILTGACKAVEGLKVIICSRPCEKFSWLARNCPFDRHLEVVGFTDEKIAQFIEAYYGPCSQKACDLQAELATRPNVCSLMHTPLLATMICRQFEMDKALPSTQTDLYQSVAMTMLQQSTARAGTDAPDSILEDISPPHLQLAVANLSRLAYDALSTKIVVFKRSELEAANCLRHALQLGLLSASPGLNIVGHKEDVFAFPHHTLLEFFAAVYAVRDLVGAGKKTVFRLVDELGVDGDLAQFWVFVSGLLAGEHCEDLLEALVFKANAQSAGVGDTMQRHILLYNCYAECEGKLQGQSSPAVTNCVESGGMGMCFSLTHLSVTNIQGALCVIRRHGREIPHAIFEGTTIDPDAALLLCDSLQVCQNLSTMIFPVSPLPSAALPGVVQIIERNAATLRILVIPAADDDLPAIAPAIKKCSVLCRLQIGSQRLASAAAPSVASILRHQHSLPTIGLYGSFDDEGFEPIAHELRHMSDGLDVLELISTRLSPAMIANVLSSLHYLTDVTVWGNPIGDEGLHQLTKLQSLPSLRKLAIFDAGLTTLSVSALEKVLLSLPERCTLEVLVNGSIFRLNEENVAFILSSTSLVLRGRELLTSKGYLHAYGHQITEVCVFDGAERRQLTIYLSNSCASK